MDLIVPNQSSKKTQFIRGWMIWIYGGLKQSDVTYFSLSPSHLETKSADDTDKNVELLASVATALAK